KVTFDLCSYCNGNVNVNVTIMKNLLKNCSRTEISASPENWKTTTAKASLQKNWYIQCDFFDPEYQKKYPKGKPFRVKVNKGTYTIEQRRAAIIFAIEEMKKKLDDRNYNPISKKYMTAPF